MSKALIISGPTATGKTNLALQLAKEFDGELLSTDSRQVYEGMDIGTGKDIPSQFEGFRFKVSGFSREIIAYSNGKTKIWGYDLVKPHQPFSLGDFIKTGQTIIQDIFNRDKLPIIVGGTGLYIKGLINPPKTTGIPPNKSLRTKLEKLNLEDLKSKLIKEAPKKYDSMNRSDRHNSRRLIRAIEVASYQDLGSVRTANLKILIKNTLWIGLKLDKKTISERIKARVEKRIKEGMIEEARRLKLHSLNDSLPAKTTIGYSQIQSYLDGDLTLDEAKEQWVLAEKQYVKRQMTWFNKQKQISWFDADNNSHRQQIVDVVRQWYSESTLKNY